MAKTKVKKKGNRKQVPDAVASLKNFDKSLSKAMKSISGSINISIRTDHPNLNSLKDKKKVKK